MEWNTSDCNVLIISRSTSSVCVCAHMGVLGILAKTKPSNIKTVLEKFAKNPSLIAT